MLGSGRTTSSPSSSPSLLLPESDWVVAIAVAATDSRWRKPICSGAMGDRRRHSLSPSPAAELSEP